VAREAPFDDRDTPWRPPPQSAWRAWGINLVLFLLTAASVYLAGGPALVLGLLSILLAHEMGHYVACVIYRVDATLPYFIPVPLPGFTLVGTLGAFIRIRSPIPHRTALFDIGIAGPLAGFAVCLPVLLLGTMEVVIKPGPPQQSGGPYLGMPLLFDLALDWLRGPIPADAIVILGPIGLAAWFGLFVTFLNLLPIGQLDGGHVTYALFRRRALTISRVASIACLLMAYFGPNWLVWSIVLQLLGRRHPPTLNDTASIGRGRRLVAGLGLAVFVVCFMPAPFVFSWREAFDALRSWWQAA
jgi:membrane-associated protease RseP (regulator of RpoE activity)